MGDEPVTKQDLASFKDFVVSQLALHKSVISSEVQKSKEAASAALSASNSLKEQSEIKFNHTGVLADLDPPRFGPPGPNPLANMDPPVQIR